MDDAAKDTKLNQGLIKANLQRAFTQKAEEDLPSDLLALIERLREQDDQDGK